MNKNNSNNKKWYVLVFIAVLIVSNIATFVFTNLITIAVGDKVIVQAKDAHTADFITKMLNLKNEIQTSYYKDVDEQALFDGALAGMFDAVGDPYTAYYNEDQFSTYLEQLEGSYVGIGVVVTMSDDDRVTIVSPIDGSPGQKAGLASGDIIMAVDGEEIKGLNLEEVVALIKGEEGTPVEITVLKRNSGEEINMSIVREEIVMTSVSSQVYENIGYMTISQFEPYTFEEFERQLDELIAQGVEGIVFDLRDNPGGMMNAVVDMLDRIMGESVIVYTQDKQGNREYERSTDRQKLELPMAVIINEGSASAAEIFAGALQDTGEGVIVGTTSFGKGIVQRMSDYRDGTGYKITISEYFTPNGRNIHGIGIEPDIIVEIDEELLYSQEYRLEDDEQFLKAVEAVRE